MRRSSTTVSGPATVRLCRYGEKLLQNSSDNTRPRAPAAIRMIPTVLMLKPEVVTSTAKVKMAHHQQKDADPKAQSCSPPPGCFDSYRWPGPACMGYLVRPCTRALLLRFPASTQGGAVAAQLRWKKEDGR